MRVKSLNHWKGSKYFKGLLIEHALFFLFFISLFIVIYIMASKELFDVEYYFNANIFLKWGSIVVILIIAPVYLRRIRLFFELMRFTDNMIMYRINLKDTMISTVVEQQFKMIGMHLKRREEFEGQSRSLKNYFFTSYFLEESKIKIYIMKSNSYDSNLFTFLLFESPTIDDHQEIYNIISILNQQHIN